MSHEAAHQSEGTGRSHAWIYWALGLAFLALAIIGLLSYGEDRKDQEAQAKAAQVAAQFEAQGFPVPEDLDVFASTFGTDGGAICEDPASALKKGLYDVSLANGAATVGIRPVTVDRRVVQGQLIVLGVYCPEELPDFEKFIEDKDYDDVIKE